MPATCRRLLLVALRECEFAKSLQSQLQNRVIDHKRLEHRLTRQQTIVQETCQRFEQSGAVATPSS